MFGETLLFQYIADESAANLLYLFLLIFCVGAGVAIDRRVVRRDAATDEDTTRGRFDPYVVLLLAAIAAGAAIRFYGLDWGLPRPYHPDEFEEAGYLATMMKNGSINPHYAQQPPLILYLSWPISVLLNHFEIFSDNTVVRNVLAGRVVNALAGTISIGLLYLLGVRLSSRLTGIVAALLLAVSPLHITNSRYMKQDALLVMFVLGCALAVIKCIDTKKMRYLYLGAISAGLAAGSKYSGLACIGILLSAPWLGSPRFSLRPDFRLARHAVLACVVMAAAFFLSMPYVLYSAENFSDLVRGMAFESRHARSGHHHLSIDAWNQLWMFHFSRSLIPGIHFLPMIAALFGVGMMLNRGTTRGLWMFALVLMFYLPAELARSKPPPQPDRYVLACIPFVALLAAEFLRTFRVQISARGLAAAVLLLIVLPLGRSLQLAAELRHDTRQQMTEWLGAHLPAGAKILKSGAGAYLPRIPNKLRSASAREVIGRDKKTVIRDLRESAYDYLLTTSISTGRFSIKNLPPGNDRPLAVRRAMREIEQNFAVVKKIAPKWGSYGFHNPTLTLYALKTEK